MSYRVKLGEPLAQEVRRIGLEQIETARRKIAGDGDAAAAIHDARRCLKRIRALIRLVRPALADDLCRKELERLAAISRLLSEARDRYVMQQTLLRLEARVALPSKAVTQVQKLIVTSGPDRGSSGDGRAAALLGLKQARKLFGRRVLATIDFAQLVEGIERTYRKARRAFREAYRKPDDENFHSFRKAAQLHWRHMLLVSEGWPDVLSGRARTARELSRLLGEEHDLSVLRLFIKGPAAAVLGAGELKILARSCLTWQRELRALALPHAERLFAERAGKFSEQVAVYWSAAQRMATKGPEGSRRVMIADRRLARAKQAAR